MSDFIQEFGYILDGNTLQRDVDSDAYLVFSIPHDSSDKQKTTRIVRHLDCFSKVKAAEDVFLSLINSNSLGFCCNSVFSKLCLLSLVLIWREMTMDSTSLSSVATIKCTLLLLKQLYLFLFMTISSLKWTRLPLIISPARLRSFSRP